MKETCSACGKPYTREDEWPHHLVPTCECLECSRCEKRFLHDAVSGPTIASTDEEAARFDPDDRGACGACWARVLETGEWPKPESVALVWRVFKATLPRGARRLRMDLLGEVHAEDATEAYRQARLVWPKLSTPTKRYPRGRLQCNLEDRREADMTVNEFARKLHKADAKERGRLYDSATEFLSSRKAAIDAIEGTVSVDRAMADAYPSDETFRVNVLKAEKALKTLWETP